MTTAELIYQLSKYPADTQVVREDGEDADIYPVFCAVPIQVVEENTVFSYFHRAKQNEPSIIALLIS